jgi:hypothetical protein
MEDYFSRYLRDGGFDMPALIDDDLIKPVRILWAAEHYVSALKLLLCAIDTLGYLAYGDDRAAFRLWLHKYADVTALGVTADELWEHRNGLLHSGGLNSMKVRKGKISRLVGYVGELPSHWPMRDTEAKWFSILGLLRVVATGVQHYIQGMNESREGFDIFLERYDQIVSDSRLMRVEIDSGT